MSNLRPERTSLPFIVFIPQRDEASHDIRVKVSPAPRVQRDQMGSYALRPVLEWKAGRRISTKDEAFLQHWIELNQKVLIDYWNGAIEYTEDVLAQVRSI